MSEPANSILLVGKGQQRPSYGRYYEYRLDAFEHFGAPDAGFATLMVKSVGPVTEISEYIHSICRQSANSETLHVAFERAMPGSIAKIWPLAANRGGGKIDPSLDANN